MSKTLKRLLTILLVLAGILMYKFIEARMNMSITGTTRANSRSNYASTCINIGQASNSAYAALGRE
jgi:hypothetical protein